MSHTVRYIFIYVLIIILHLLIIISAASLESYHRLTQPRTILELYSKDCKRSLKVTILLGIENDIIMLKMLKIIMLIALSQTFLKNEISM